MDLLKAYLKSQTNTTHTSMMFVSHGMIHVCVVVVCNTILGSKTPRARDARQPASQTTDSPPRSVHLSITTRLPFLFSRITKTGWGFFKRAKEKKKAKGAIMYFRRRRPPPPYSCHQIRPSVRPSVRPLSGPPFYLSPPKAGRPSLFVDSRIKSSYGTS
jgi:hypothetical protein